MLTVTTNDTRVFKFTQTFSIYSMYSGWNLTSFWGLKGGSPIWMEEDEQSNFMIEGYPHFNHFRKGPFIRKEISPCSNCG